MLQVSIYNQSGEEMGKLDLNPNLFEVPINQSVVHEAVVSQQANSRVTLAHSKGRSDVRGGGKKPWKQKGTGRARHGSIRSPLWKGGGVTFGPLNIRNFVKKINRKTKQKALAMVLSDVVSNNVFFVVDSLVLPEFKTKTLSKMLKTLPEPEKKTLIIVEEENTGIGVAANNMDRTQVIPVNCLNVLEILKAGRIVASQDAVMRMNELFAKNKSV